MWEVPLEGSHSSLCNAADQLNAKRSMERRNTEQNTVQNLSMESETCLLCDWESKDDQNKKTLRKHYEQVFEEKKI
jgi:hypothetical protein